MTRQKTCLGSDPAFHPRRAFILALGLASVILVAGACTIRQEFSGSPAPEDRVSKLQPALTKGYVLDLLGPPDTVAKRLKGSLFIYRYHNEGDTGFRVSVFRAALEFDTSDSRTDRLLVFFDKKGRVTHWALDREPTQ